jgi:hypothetical protein
MFLKRTENGLSCVRCASPLTSSADEDLLLRNVLRQITPKERHTLADGFQIALFVWEVVRGFRVSVLELAMLTKKVKLSLSTP